MIAWGRTGDAHFPSAVCVDGAWWVLRVNGFPDHPLWTLFVGGAAREHVEDALPGWSFDGPPLDAGTASRVLAPLRGLEAFGAEVGDPCEGPYCCG